MTAAQQAGMSVAGLTVRYGGLQAVSEVSLMAPPGRLTGLIGPNGAGKTTTFNALCGLVRPSGGTIRLDGIDITRQSPSTRARMGLGRTFQHMELFDSLTVLENLALGYEAKIAGSRPLRHLFTRKSERAAVAQAANDALELCGIVALADRRAGVISTGQRRLVELARAIAGQFPLLLLDEPSAGLDRAETTRLGQILRQLVAERDTGVLLVEHDMSLVMEVCDYIYVIDFGHPIFEGTPVEVRLSEAVRAAYLGSDAAVAGSRASDAEAQGC